MSLNSKFNGMPRWQLSVEKCPATKGFVGLSLIPGQISSGEPSREQKRSKDRLKFVDITKGRER